MVRGKLETSEMTVGRALAATAIALSLAAPSGVPLSAGTGGAGGVRLVVAAPWDDADAAAAAAGGRLAGPRQSGFARVAAGGEGFPRRLRRPGAWLVVGYPRPLPFCGARS